MAATERTFPARSTVFSGGRILPSPSSFYLTGEDRLRVVSACAVAGVNLILAWRRLDTSGQAFPNVLAHTPNADRTTKTQDYDLGEGELLNVTVFANAGAPIIGQCYVMVQLVRGVGPAAIVLGTLLAGYVTAVQALGFPGSPIQSSIEGPGAIRNILGTDPGAGVEITETVPVGARWELMQFTATLVCSAAAAGRLPQLTIFTPGDNPGVYVGQYSANGLETSIYCWAQGMNNTGFAVTERSNAAMGNNLPLLAGQTIRTVTINFDAGDNWTAPKFTVREWLEVN